MKTQLFEVTLRGFNGGTDATDGQVKWFKAFNREQVAEYLKEKGLEYIEIFDMPKQADFLCAESDIDFDLTVKFE